MNRNFWKVDLSKLLVQTVEGKTLNVWESDYAKEGRGMLFI